MTYKPKFGRDVGECSGKKQVDHTHVLRCRGHLATLTIDVSGKQAVNTVLTVTKAVGWQEFLLQYAAPWGQKLSTIFDKDPRGLVTKFVLPSGTLLVRSDDAEQGNLITLFKREK
jgi:hypothetical protein